MTVGERLERAIQALRWISQGRECHPELCECIDYAAAELLAIDEPEGLPESVLRAIERVEKL